MAHPALLSSRIVAYHAGTLADAQEGRTPASAYACEQRMLKRYRELLYSMDTDSDALLIACFNQPLAEALALRSAPRPVPLTNEQSKAYGAALKKINSAEERLDYEVPELIEKLQWDEQPAIEALLTEGNLVGCIRAILAMERTLLQREEPNTGPDDQGHMKAAGMGHISSQNYGKLHSSARAGRRQVANLQEEDEMLHTELLQVTPITHETHITSVPSATPIANTTNTWPHADCAVCPGPALRIKSPRARDRKRLQFDYCR